MLLVLFIVVSAPLFWNITISSVATLINSESLCYLNVSGGSKSVIFNKSFRDSCLFKTSMVTEGIKYCDSLDSNNIGRPSRDECYIMVFNRTKNRMKNKDICNKIEDKIM